MLEETDLILGATGSGGWTIQRQDGGTLGTARWDEGSTSWWGWLMRPCLSVREDLDEPLVCTIRRRLSLRRCYEVLDAEGYLVGVATPRGIRCWGGAALARKPQGTEATLYLDARGEQVACCRFTKGMARLTFLPPAWDEPFLKMLILGAVLVLEGSWARPSP